MQPNSTKSLCQDLYLDLLWYNDDVDFIKVYSTNKDIVRYA